MLIRSGDSVLLVIDMQERLVPATQAPARTLRNARLPLTAAAACEVPALLTGQYPKGLGSTVPEIRAAAGESPVLEKLHFSCMEDETFAHAFGALGRRQPVLAGMEAHICVVQTRHARVQYPAAVDRALTGRRSRAIEELSRPLPDDARRDSS